MLLYKLRSRECWHTSGATLRFWGRILGSVQLVTGEPTEVYRESSALVPQSRQAPLSPERGTRIVVRVDIDPEKLWNWGHQAPRRSSVRLRADTWNVVKYGSTEARG